MSVINQMLKDLDQRQQGSDGAAVYIAPARQQGWWMLLLTLICGLALGILGWRTWIYWQQTHPVVAASEVVTPDVVTPDVVTRAAAPVSQPEPVEVAAALPLPSQDEVNDEAGEGDSGDTADGAPFDASSDFDESEPTDEELQPELYAELAAEQQAVASAPRKPSVLKIETVELSAKELAALAERKATTAMAKGSLRDAQDNYYDVLAHDPYNQGAREQLALAAGLAVEPVDEEDAVEVVGLVLEAAGQQSGAGELDVDVVVREGQQHMDGRGLREESIRRKAEYEGRTVGCGGELIVAVAVSRGGRRDFFQPLEREGEAGKLLQLDLVRLDAQHGGSLRLGDVVSEAPLGQKNACEGEFIGDSLTQDGV